MPARSLWGRPRALGLFLAVTTLIVAACSADARPDQQAGVLDVPVQELSRPGEVRLGDLGAGERRVIVAMASFVEFSASLEAELAAAERDTGVPVFVVAWLDPEPAALAERGQSAGLGSDVFVMSDASALGPGRLRGAAGSQLWRSRS